MCFSAGASFVTSGALAAAGTASIERAKKFKAIAFVPLIFSIQQFVEGLVWVLQGKGELALMLGYAFLFFAFLLWPIYVPFAVITAETERAKRKRLYPFLVGGFFTSLFLLYILLTYPLAIQCHPAGIEYLLRAPVKWFGALWYILVVVGSLFASSHKTIRRFGILVLVSAVLTFFIFRQSFISVWCFFAAILSLYIIFALNDKNLKD